MIMMAPADLARDDLFAGRHLLPDHLWSGIHDHVMVGMPTGDFLTAVLSNDFADAVLRADPISTHSFRDIVLFLHSHTPRQCRGSREAVAEWRRRGGVEGGAF